MSKENTLYITCITILGLFIYAGFYCHPSGDDFTYAILGQNENFLEAVLKERKVWNGRYFSNFILFLNPLNYGGIDLYKASPFILITALITGISFFFKKIIGKGFLILALLSTLLSFSLMPDITEGLYWYTSAWTYIPSALVLLIGIAYSNNNSRKEIYHYFLIFGIYIIAGGFNETITMIALLFHLFSFIFSKKKKYVVYSLFFSLILIYILTAPGNEIRISHFQENHQFFKSIFLSIVYTGRFLAEWILNPFIVFFTFFLLKSKDIISTRTKLSVFQNPIVVILTLLVPTFICCFGPIWSTGILGQYRTANLSCFLFVISYSIIIIANKGFLLKKFRRLFKFKYGFTCLILCVCLWKNQFYLVSEFINGKMFYFDIEMKQRYDLIKNCGYSDCYLPTIKNKSEILFVYPLVKNPENWQNKNYQRYFDSGKIFKAD